LVKESGLLLLQEMMTINAHLAGVFTHLQVKLGSAVLSAYQCVTMNKLSIAACRMVLAHWNKTINSKRPARQKCVCLQSPITL
jgi:hypothetical protein